MGHFKDPKRNHSLPMLALKFQNTFLFVAKYEINPLVKVCRNIFAFKRVPMLSYKIVHIGRPGWKYNITDSLIFPLKTPEVKVVEVQQEIREIEELRDKFLDVVDVIDETTPGLWKGVELTVSHVKPTGLKVDVKTGEWFHPHHVVENHRRVGVVGSIMKLGNGSTRILKVLILLPNFGHMSWVLYSHRFREVPESGRGPKVQGCRVVV